MDELAEAWEVQRKYGGIDRPKGAGDDDERAPPFRAFVTGGWGGGDGVWATGG